MCGRMTLTRSGREIADYFAEAVLALKAGTASVPEVREFDGQPLRARFNMAPSQEVLALTLASKEASVSQGEASVRLDFEWKRWGLVPSWAKDPKIGARLFNARSETVAEKPSFRSAFKRHRCLVVTDGFYEWTPKTRDHQPYYFSPTDQPVMALAGLHETWQGEGGEVIESCTVLTTEANADLEGVHHRMPVILEAADYAPWLKTETSAEALLHLTRPAQPGKLERRKVSRKVNRPQHDDASCLEAEPENPPVPEPDEVQGAIQPDLFAAEAVPSKSSTTPRTPQTPKTAGTPRPRRDS